jgi:hypothetical protein
MRISRVKTAVTAVAVLLGATGCDTTTSKLSPATEQRFAAEGIVRRADDLNFRYTRNAGGRDASWEARRASILVTGKSVLIHKNDKIGLEVTPATRRYVDVARDGTRVRIRAGSGRSQEVWSFEPESDPAGWTDAIRVVARASRSTANR